MDPERFEKQMEFLLANQAKHDGQIHGLIRLAELQQSSLERFEANMARSKQEADAEFRQMRKELDQRIGQLVGTIGEWIRRRRPRLQIEDFRHLRPMNLVGVRIAR